MFLDRRVILSGALMAACSCSPPPPATDRAAGPAPSSLPPPVASVAPTLTSVAELRALAPELTDRSAAQLIERHAVSGLPPETIVEAGIAIASVGFGVLDAAEQSEVGALLDRAYSFLGDRERARLGAYLEHLRSGGAGAEESRIGRELFNRALRELDPARRERLMLLFERGIDAGIRHQAEAQGRTRDAQVVAVATPSIVRLPVLAGVRTGGVSGAVSGVPGSAAVEPSATRGRGEAYWRGEAKRRRDAVATAEREVIAAETASKGYIYPPDTAERQPAFYKGRAAAQARQARAEAVLGAARQRLSDLDDEARRDHALPGWLR